MSFDKIVDIFNNFFSKPTETPKIPNDSATPIEPIFYESDKLIHVPDRMIDAVTGSQFIRNNFTNVGKIREDNIVKEITSGNVPDFLKDLKGITLTKGNDRITYYVTPDYLSLGTNDDYVRIPMSPLSAQKIADTFNCILPTRKMVNDIWKYSINKLSPNPIPPDAKMSSTPRYKEHNLLVQTQLALKDFKELTSGHKKDVVLTNKLYPNNVNKRVAIYGWIRLNGVPIQDLNPRDHDWNYADYSHGIRLISRKILVNDEIKDIVDILKDNNLSILLSDEGALNFLRY